jgi:hypothetical protein
MIRPSRWPIERVADVFAWIEKESVYKVVIEKATRQAQEQWRSTKSETRLVLKINKTGAEAKREKSRVGKKSERANERTPRHFWPASGIAARDAYNTKSTGCAGGGNFHSPLSLSLSRPFYLAARQAVW